MMQKVQNQGQMLLMSHLHTNLLRILKKQANAVFTISALYLLLTLHFLHHICPKEISCKCILPWLGFGVLQEICIYIILMWTFYFYEYFTEVLCVVFTRFLEDFNKAFFSRFSLRKCILPFKVFFTR